jgi:hypothetical protein
MSCKGPELLRLQAQGRPGLSVPFGYLGGFGSLPFSSAGLCRDINSRQVRTGRRARFPPRYAHRNRIPATAVLSWRTAHDPLEGCAERAFGFISERRSHDGNWIGGIRQPVPGQQHSPCFAVIVAICFSARAKSQPTPPSVPSTRCSRRA